jgi:hypothetical protein
MTGRTSDPCDEEQPTENHDLKGTFHGAEISHRGPLSPKKAVYRGVLASLFRGLSEPNGLIKKEESCLYTRLDGASRSLLFV